MATGTIKVLLPALEASNDTNKQSVEIGVAATGSGSTVGTTIATAASTALDITVQDAMACKNNSMYIIANITTVGATGTITIAAGDEYPNRVLGDYVYECSAGYNAILLEDISRFENRDGSILVKCGASLVGDILVIGKRVGVDNVASQNSRDTANHRNLHKTTYAG